MWCRCPRATESRKRGSLPDELRLRCSLQNCDAHEYLPALQPATCAPPDRHRLLRRYRSCYGEICENRCVESKALISRLLTSGLEVVYRTEEAVVCGLSVLTAAVQRLRSQCATCRATAWQRAEHAVFDGHKGIHDQLFGRAIVANGTVRFFDEAEGQIEFLRADH